MFKVRNNTEKWVSIVLATILIVFCSVSIERFLLGDHFNAENMRVAVLVPLVIAPLFGLVASNRLLEIHRLNQELEHLLAHDQMTQLLTRAHFMRRLDEMSEDFKGCFLMLDIDLFKSVNDTYGHLVGDEVIRRVAGVIREHVHQDGLAARYGGEEFVVCLPHKEMDEAMRRAEEIRKAVEQQKVTVSGQELSCTISIGLGYADGQNPPEEVLRRADDALYVAKNAGRNQVGAPQQSSA